MLEHVPAWLGQLLTNVRAGHGKLVVAGLYGAAGLPPIELSSPAFAKYGRLPERFTADGEGVSPPLVWGDVPPATRSLALIVEDPDAPAPEPLVHAVVWELSGTDRRIVEGAITADGGESGMQVGRNSSRRKGWLPPDPPTGHGNHDYVFQLFALDVVPVLGDDPGRTALVDAIAGHVLAAGVLVGIYSRGEVVPLPAGALQPA